jgi:hypothetical protein
MRFFIFVVLLVLSFSGCASVSVVDQRDYLVDAPPSQIFVAPFVFRGSEFHVNRSGEEFQSFCKTFQRMFQSYLVRSFVQGNRGELSVRAINGLTPFPPSSWVVEGEFLRVCEGSRAARASIGLGIGASQLQTYVRVYAVGLNGKRVLVTSFWTTGGSNSEPGGAYYFPFTTPRMLHAAFSTGLSYDSLRTAKQVAAAVLERAEGLGGGPYCYTPLKRQSQWFWARSFR